MVRFTGLFLVSGVLVDVQVAAKEGGGKFSDQLLGGVALAPEPPGQVTVEAGLVLQGTEVKSLRGRRCNLKDSHARVRDGEMWLFGVHISPYEQGNRNNHDPERPRKLLLHRREIARLKSGIDERGLTLVPLSMYFKRGKAKVELALAKGKAEYDKRAVIVERENQRNIARALKEY